MPPPRAQRQQAPSRPLRGNPKRPGSISSSTNSFLLLRIVPFLAVTLVYIHVKIFELHSSEQHDATAAAAATFLEKHFVRHDDDRPRASPREPHDDSSPSHENNDETSKVNDTETTEEEGEVDPDWWSGLRECKYEGNCPRGTTCAWNPRRSSLGGFCEPYLPDDASKVSLLVDTTSSVGGGGGRRRRPVDVDDDADTMEECSEVCRNDVEIDERFYFKAKVKIEGVVRAMPSRGRPGGCVVLFRRRFKYYRRGLVVKTWRSDSREAIVRVDPVMTTGGRKKKTRKRERQIWAALCYAPCKKNSMCNTGSSGRLEVKHSEEPPFFCLKKKGTCQRRRRWIPPNPDGFNDLVVVTGANSLYFSGLKNAVASLHYWAPKNRVVVYNLGMRSDQIEEVKKWPNVAAVEWEDGKPPPSRYPDHVADPKMFAWKVVAIDETLRRYNMTFWTDAGSTVTGPLDPLERIIEQTGVFLTWGQDDDMTASSMYGTYDYFNVSKDSFGGYPHYSGNTQGFLLPSPYADSVLGPTVRCALVKECIDKPSKTHWSERGRHRYDQTVMSIVAYRPNVMPRHHTELLASSESQLNQDLRRPSGMIVYTSRQKCNFYSELMGW